MLPASGLLVLVLLIFSAVPASAQCPVSQQSPSFTSGGTVFGKTAAQWDQYFRLKADANNGTLCNPTIIGGNIQVDVPVTPISTGTAISLTAPRQYFVCTGTCTVTPPAPAAGYEFCIFNDNNVATVITLAALGSSAQYENTARTAYGTAGTGTFTSSGAVGDMVCIVGRDSTHYITTTFKGTWTAN